MTDIPAVEQPGSTDDLQAQAMLEQQFEEQDLNAQPGSSNSPALRGRAALIGALVAATTTLVLPSLLFLSSGGEICEGYQTDALAYFGKAAAFALVAGLLGALVGALIGWPGRFLTDGEIGGWRIGCGVAAVSLGLLGLAMVSCVVAIFPGC